MSAVELTNTELTSVAALEAHLASRPWLAGTVTGRDVAQLRAFQTVLRQTFEAGAAGDDATVVANLNELLERHPVRPRISGHDTESWHLHVHDKGASAAQVLAAEILFGLALVVTEVGADRLGVCGAADCRDVFVDLSPNTSRRFCGERCATRTNVAAYRARRRAAG